MQNHGCAEATGHFQHRWNSQVATHLRQVGTFKTTGMKINQRVAMLNYLSEETVRDPRGGTPVGPAWKKPI